MKKLLSILLTVVSLLSLSMPALAAADFHDVADNAWYAGDVSYCKNAGLISGTSNTTFSPNASADRAMLVTVLHRQAGEPDPVSKSGFSDMRAESYYEAAINWAAETGVAFGVTNLRFAPHASVTREQVAAFLWRREGSPNPADTAPAFADASDISAYAVPAVEWAREQGVISGKGNNLFDPQGTATRAELAAMLHRWLSSSGQNTPSVPNVPGVPNEPETPGTPEVPDQPATGSKTLVVYFSASNNTERVAGYIADALSADTFELVPEAPYTSADLSWTTPGSRVNREHDNENLRDIALTADTVENWKEYDTIFIGYPIWWGIAAWPVNNFIKNNDFTGKTVIPFCTSSSSGLGQSGRLLAEMAGTGDWQEGQRFSSGASESTVKEWVAGLT